MALSLSAKAFSVSARSVWNSLSFDLSLASSFQRIRKTELFDIAYGEHSDYSLRHHAPQICLWYIGDIETRFDWKGSTLCMEGVKTTKPIPDYDIAYLLFS